MKIETLLPLGKVDPGLRETETPLDICRVADEAKQVEALGYDGLVMEETKDDPFVALGLAAQATRRLALSTAVAIAFPRSPAITALSAWTLQKLSHGRFTLGLGPQVKGHITRRYGLDWSPAGPWMRDYVGAVRAVWNSWQNRAPLNYESEHYTLSLTVPLFDPGPIDHPNIPVHLAAVNRVMCTVAGEVADGLRPHPVCTPKYIAETMLPAAAQGARKTGRSPGAMAVCMKPLIATAPDAASLETKIRDVRARVAFYASTPAYRAPFDAHGLGALADELALLSKAQRWQDMPGLIDDDVLETYAVVAPFSQIAHKLKERYEGIATHIEFSIPLDKQGDEATLRDMIATLRAG